MLTKDSGGDSFNFLTNPCRDGVSSNGACGNVLEHGSGTAIPYSQGFCCKCQLDDYLGECSHLPHARDTISKLGLAALRSISICHTNSTKLCRFLTATLSAAL